jgi:hypothetical protein
VGGGFTQTKPSTAGQAVQVLGVSLSPMEDGVNPQNVNKDRLLLDVESGYDTV